MCFMFHIFISCVDFRLSKFKMSSVRDLSIIVIHIKNISISIERSRDRGVEEEVVDSRR